VVVYVSDDNDNVPVRRNRDVSDVLEVAENAPPGTVVGRVGAADADIGRNAELTYVFAGGAPVAPFLILDPRTGKSLFLFLLGFRFDLALFFARRPIDRGPS